MLKQQIKRRHNIYVIELDKSVLTNKKFINANPEYKDGKPCVYVGLTGRSPEERFMQHKAGYKSSNIARRYGIRLKPRQFEAFNPMTYDEACDMEKEKTRRLRNKGWGVWSN